VYKISDEKLVKEVNKATCKRCGHKIIIRKPRAAAAVEGPSERTIISPGGPAAERPKKKKDEKTVITTIPELEKYESAAVSAGAIGSLTAELRTITAPADVPAPTATDSLGPQESSYKGFDDSPAVGEPPPMPEMPAPPPPPPPMPDGPVSLADEAPTEIAPAPPVVAPAPEVAPPPPPTPAPAPAVAPPPPAPAVAPPPPTPAPQEQISIAQPPSTGPLFDQVEAAAVSTDGIDQADLNSAINKPAPLPPRDEEPAALPPTGEVRTATRDLEVAHYQPKTEFLGIIFFSLVAMLGLVITSISGALPVSWFVPTVGYGLIWTAVLASFLVAILSGLGRKKGHAFVMLILAGILGFGVAFGLNYGIRAISAPFDNLSNDWQDLDLGNIGDGAGDALGDLGEATPADIGEDATEGEDATAGEDATEGEDPTEAPTEDPTEQDAAADNEQPTPPPAENPAIIFSSSPSGADVYMDGRRLGRAAYRYEQGSAGRRYSVTFKKSGYEDATASGTFPSDGSITVRGSLKKIDSGDAVGDPGDDPDPPDLGAASDLPDASEVLTPSIIEAIVGSNASIKRCFAEAQARGDVVGGKLWVKFTVNPDGNVSKAHIVTADYAGTDLDSCVSGQINRLQFAPFAGTTSKTVKYPFVVR
jgi:DNA-directed RNA polymerase subunit RPC12/RpoP